MVMSDVREKFPECLKKPEKGGTPTDGLGWNFDGGGDPTIETGPAIFIAQKAAMDRNDAWTNRVRISVQTLVRFRRMISVACAHTSNSGDK